MNEKMRVALLAVLLATSIVPTLATHAVAGYPGGGYSGAPGPLLGAGIPFLVVVGGVYWVARRFRRKSEFVKAGLEPIPNCESSPTGYKCWMIRLNDFGFGAYPASFFRKEHF